MAISTDPSFGRQMRRGPKWARGAELEAAIAALDLGSGRHFSAVRRDVREFIAKTDGGRDAEALVQELLS